MTLQESRNTFKLEDFLYEESSNLYYRNDKGQISKCPKNKFFDGEIVRTNESHYSPNDFVMVIEPYYDLNNETWRYGKRFISLQGRSGGSSFSTNEDEFVKLSRTDDILMAERIYLKEEIAKAENHLSVMKENLSKIEYSCSVSVKDYSKVTHSCKKCFTYFEGFNGGDPNKDLCTNCLNEKK